MDTQNTPDGYAQIPVEELRGLRDSRDELLRVNRVIAETSDKLREWDDTERPVDFRLQRLLSKMNSKNERQYHNVIAFREHVIIAFRALEIVVSGVLMASTHREKDARLRGLLDTVSASTDEIKNLTRAWFSFDTWGESLFRADSSIPHLQRRVWEQEQRLEAHHAKFGALEQPEEQTDGDGIF